MTHDGKAKKDRTLKEKQNASGDRIARIWQVVSGRDNDIPGNKAIMEAIRGIKRDEEKNEGGTDRHQGKYAKHDRIRDWISFWFSIIVNVVTVVALIIALIQIFQADDAYQESVRQFNESGPKYSWFMLDIDPRLEMGNESASTQTAIPVVISNSGRTEDTIIAMRRETKDKETMRFCIPDTGDQGNPLKDGSVRLDDGTMRLAPGESRIIFLNARRTGLDVERREPGTITLSGGGFEISKTMTVYGADGKGRHAEYLDDVPDEVKTHYSRTPGLEQMKENCGLLMDEER